MGISKYAFIQNAVKKETDLILQIPKPKLSPAQTEQVLLDIWEMVANQDAWDIAINKNEEHICAWQRRH